MNKILGIFGLLIFVCVFTTVLNDSFVSALNMYNITRWSALFGILSIGVAFVIITGGIDLSIGSVVGLIGCLLPMFITEMDVSPLAAICWCLLISAGIGLLHGLLITKLELQPFVVTLCGLLFYRGFARWIADDRTLGLGQTFDESLRLLARGKPCSWATLLLIGGVILGLFSLFKLIRRSVANDRSAKWIVMLIIGVLLIVVGSSRFWFGVSTSDGPTLFSVGGLQLQSVAISVPDHAVEMPGKILCWLGALLFVPLAVWFSLLGLKSDRKRTAIEIVAVAVAGMVLALCIVVLVPVFRSAGDGETWQFGALEMQGKTLRTLIMGIVFLSVGSLMGAIGWLVSSVSNASATAKTILPLVLTTSVMILMGNTSLAQTMVPMPMLIMVGLGIVASVILNRTIFGRYLLALGRNEEAARYSGINTAQITVAAYVICSMAAGLGGILFSLDINSVQPSGFGNFWELYAIAAAVLGGCSLRGGEGSIAGVIIGAAVMRVLYNAINILGISTKLEFSIIGIVILTGAIVDVLVKRIVSQRAAIAEAKLAEE